MRLPSKRALSWAFYDWGNSAFATTVMAGFFALYFKSYSNAGVSSDVSAFRLGVCYSLSGVVVALLAPLLGAVSDRSGNRKSLLFVFTGIGVISTALLAAPGEGQWFFAAMVFFFSLIGFNGAIVFYDAMLPEAAEGDSADFVSSLGYSLGYLGGGILFAVNVLMYLKPEWWAISSSGDAVRVSFLSVALWWAVFSIPLFREVPEGERRYREPIFASCREGIRQLACTLRELFGRQRNVLLFLAAYWLYIDAVNTVIKMAVDYGVSIGFGAEHLIGALLLTQFVGFPCALVFGVLGERIGAKKAVQIGLLLYCGIVVWASQLSNEWEFYALAVSVGMVQGGVQALSRSLFAKMVPEEHAAEYFGFYNLVGKFATILGPMLVGVITLWSGSHRTGILGILLLFAVGSVLLALVKNNTCIKNNQSVNI